MSVFDHHAFKLGLDMKAHPCFQGKASVLAIPDKKKLGWMCDTCGKEWVLCDNPRLVRQTIRYDLNVFTKAMSNVAVVIKEERCP